MSISFRPVGDRVLIRQVNAESKVGSLFVPTAAKEKPLIGEVLCIGPGRTLPNGDRCMMQVEPGMRVHYAKFVGEPITLDGEEFLIVRETDILGFEA